MSASTSSPRRRSTADKLTRRKRTIVACQFCRIRKTRCEGVRPVCGFCRHHDAQCVWGVGPEQEGYEGTPMEHEILRRLDDIKSLLSTSSFGIPPQLSPGQALPNTASALQETRPQSPTTVASQHSNLPTSAAAANPYAYTRCESLLHWPIFQDIIEPADAALESFALECNHNEDFNHTFSSAAALSSRPGNGPGIQENLFVPLCRKFLAHVHPRNPILEGSELIKHAKHAAENGLQWDGPSCLVLIACALACYTSPWQRSTLDTPRMSECLQDTDDEAAHAYYLAARKRIGLLGFSLIDIQCLFFASVYEKYALNPLQAWFYIQQASSRLQAHLKRYRGLHMQDRHLEQRVFWSVFKAEHELLPELPFKSSGIEELTRSDSMFPSPPAIAIASNTDTSTSPGEQDAWQEERSWFFYLAEISLRRTINDTLWLFYRKGEQYWITHINALLQQHEESERQIRLWYSHLPTSIRFDPMEPPDNELSFYLQGRFYEWRHYILKPLLYYALHRPSGQALTPEILACAQESVYICANGIGYYKRHHRHGGTWLVCRRTFTSALIILGVVIKNDLELPPPPNWDSLVRTAISTLCNWETQAADLRVMRLTLERLLHAACQKVGMSPS